MKHSLRDQKRDVHKQWVKRKKQSYRQQHNNSRLQKGITCLEQRVSLLKKENMAPQYINREIKMQGRHEFSKKKVKVTVWWLIFVLSLSLPPNLVLYLEMEEQIRNGQIGMLACNRNVRNALNHCVFCFKKNNLICNDAAGKNARTRTWAINETWAGDRDLRSLSDTF